VRRIAACPIEGSLTPKAWEASGRRVKTAGASNLRQGVTFADGCRPFNAERTYVQLRARLQRAAPMCAREFAPVIRSVWSTSSPSTSFTSAPKPLFRTAHRNFMKPRTKTAAMSNDAALPCATTPKTCTRKRQRQPAPSTRKSRDPAFQTVLTAKRQTGGRCPRHIT